MKNSDKKRLKKMILKEMSMLSISPMNLSQLFQGESFADDHSHDSHHVTAPRGNMSKEACCVAIEAIASCCECPETKSKILSMCSALRWFFFFFKKANHCKCKSDPQYK